MQPTARFGVVCLGLAVVAGAAQAQSSASYELSEFTLNAGGAPDGSHPSSDGYRLTFVSIGNPLAGGVDPSSASYGVSGGFVSAYPAPGEVLGLRFEDPSTLSWSPERSAGTYNLYRAGLGTLSGLGYGACVQLGLTSATASDGDTPAAADGYFYLVTVENRLGEEGTKGFDGGGGEREGNACP